LFFIVKLRKDIMEIAELMIPLSEGTERIRRFRDTEKWLSSNYQMSIPSRGKNQEQTIQDVKINPFQIAKYPVTNQLYHRIVETEELDSSKQYQPIVNISWYDSIGFCNRISKYFGFTEYYSIDEDLSEVSINSDSNGFRLPTDAEWQYACKAGVESYQYSDIHQIAWHKGNSDNHLHNVGEKQANNWELYDMLGNIWEWTWDLYNQETYRTYRIFRGGSFAEEAKICGATTRRKSHPDFSIDDLGFRLARSIV